jgi:hypothetical protein
MSKSPRKLTSGNESQGRKEKKELVQPEVQRLKEGKWEIRA